MNPTNSFNEKLKSSFDEVVNAAYRAGATGSHPNNRNLHDVVDKSVKVIRDLILSEIVGEDDDRLPNFMKKHPKFDDAAYDVQMGHRNQLRAELRNKILKEG